MPPLSPSTALLIIDVQIGLDDPALGQRNNPHAEDNMARLLHAWRAAGRPVFHVQHMSTEPQSLLRPELPGNAIKPVVAPQPGEPVIQKTVNSALVGTDLDARLRAQGIGQLVIVGLTTNHCVETTVRMAANMGYETTVVSDATATFERTGHDGVHYPAEVIHAVSLASLHREFAAITTTDALLTSA